MIILVSDTVAQFTSCSFRHMCFAGDIRYVTTSPYYRQLSHAERLSRNLGAALVAYRRTFGLVDVDRTVNMVTKYQVAYGNKSVRTLRQYCSSSTLLASLDLCKGESILSRFVMADAPVGLVYQTVTVPRDFRPGAVEFC
jgi:hypothetical protein